MNLAQFLGIPQKQPFVLLLQPYIWWITNIKVQWRDLESLKMTEFEINACFSYWKIQQTTIFLQFGCFRNVNIKVWCLFNPELYTSELYFDAIKKKNVANSIEMNGK